MRVLFKLIVILSILITGNAYAQKIKVACIGNSVTAGYLLDNPEKQSYPSRLQSLLGEAYLVGNFGHSGATLLKNGHNPYYKTREFLNVINFKADIAIIHLGLNDTDPRNWPNYRGSFAGDYNWLIDTLKKDNPNIKIYLCKMTPIFSGHPRFKSGTREWYWQIQDEILKVANINQLPLIDLNTELSKRPDLFADNLHPDSTGANIIAKTVYRKLSGNYGGFRINPVFADNMVLQRDKPITIYGTADAKNEVTVTFNNISKKAITDENGKWSVQFPPMKYGGPFQMNVQSGIQSHIIKNILIGDVWLCSGQSNMVFQLKSSDTGTETLNNINKTLNIRLLKYDGLIETDNISWSDSVLNKVNNLEYFSGNWEELNAKSAADFSAVAYYFGEKLAREEKIPIGLIQIAVGGSPLESWIDRKTLAQDNLLVDMLNNWRKSDFIQDWVRGRADINLKNSINLKQQHPYQPSYNFDAGISKLIDFPIKGVIWYQGESNAHNVELFEHEFPLLVQSWRTKWNADFPFYYVQLSSLNRPSWPYFRNAQRKLQSVIPNVYMAVSSDLGDSLNVHPTRKKEVAERLALLAERNTYHKNIIAEGPIVQEAIQISDTVILTFSNAKKLQSAGSELKGFEVEDIKGNYYEVQAKIINDTVQLKIPKGLKILTIYYAWQPFTRANLINEAGLPASTFSISIKQK